MTIKALCPTLALCALASFAAAEPLPTLNLDPGATTVSGLSSGAFMTVQLQVAFSESIVGAGVVAGGPYACADHSTWRALFVCMDPFLISADAGQSYEVMQDMADAGLIAPLGGIAKDRLYLFHGTADDTVARQTMDALRETYALLEVNADLIEYDTSVDAGHGFVTEQGPVTCAATRPDFLIDCDFDQAGRVLTHMYGELAAPSAPAAESFITFDQSLYTNEASGMDDTAFAYVPADCAAEEPCRLHIALHGCKQGREVIGTDYAKLTGYNQWAETNRIVVLYPQAIRIPSPWYNWFGGNPNGCWDWWGYSGADYLSQSAPQLAAIARMSAALGAPLAP